jgi:hypothetical protein
VGVLAAAAATALIVTHDAQAGTNAGAVTISLSGSTAMRNFTTSPSFSLVEPGTQLSVGGNLYPGSPNYWPTNGTGISFQVAPLTFPGAVTTGDRQEADAVRLEWHEQGSVEGILELVNDQIAPISSVTASNRNPTTGNPTWINRNQFNATAGRSAGDTLNGHFLGQMYSSGTATSGVPNFALNGNNPNGGQNAVQMGITDVTSRQGFSSAGTAAFNRKPGDPGYGKGNPALPLGTTTQGLGQANVHHELTDESAMNMLAGATNPRTGAAFGAGPWNTAGVGNLDNKTAAITATLFVANPGTGLEKLNRTDAQFLQAVGRLPNGADFNVATRDVNSGTLNVAAVNVGLDPSFAVGENDDANGNAADGGTTQVNIGAGIRFSNKTSGGSQLRPTVQNARMSLGHLSISDSIGSTKNSISRPIRALAYRDDANDLADGSNNAFRTTGTGTQRDAYSDPAAGAFVMPSAQSIVDGSYVIYQNETYVTVKKPGAAFAGDSVATWSARTDATTGVQGDTANNDVRSFRNNTLSSANAFPLPSNLASTASPAQGMLLTSFIIPKLMQVKKGQDGINESFANPDYDATLSGAFLGTPSLTIAFNPDDPTTVKEGFNSTYGNFAATSTAGIKISTGNYLFGNFNQNGMRDFSSVKAAQAAQAQLQASGFGTSMFAGSNAAKVAGLSAALSGMTGQDGTAGATKGDLVVMGDFDANGTFDGKDLYLMARGASLADSVGMDQLTAASGATLGDRLRKGVLRKNAALDYMQANATAQQKVDARANATIDPTGANAFNKMDVNRDGLVSRFDARTVDQFSGKDYRNLNDQLGAVITDAAGTRMISLVDAELNDTGDITRADFDIVKNQLVSENKLVGGDADFDGDVDVSDLGILSDNYSSATSRWGRGDFDGNGQVDVSDLGILSDNYDTHLLTGQPASPISIEAAAALGGIDLTAVPEPSGLALVALGAAALGSRHRPRRRRRA